MRAVLLALCALALLATAQAAPPFPCSSGKLLATYTTEGHPYALWRAEAPAGAALSFSQTEEIDGTRHARMYAWRINNGPWEVDGGLLHSIPGPSRVYATAAGAQTHVRLPETAQGGPILYFGWPRTPGPIRVDLLAAMAGLDQPAISHVSICGSAGVTFEEPVVGEATFARLTDFEGLGAGFDDALLPTTVVAEGTLERVVEHGFTGYAWAEPELAWSGTMTTPTGQRPVGPLELLVNEPPGAYRWDVTGWVGTGDGFLLLGADVRLPP